MCPASFMNMNVVIVDLDRRDLVSERSPCVQARPKIIRNEMCFVINQDRDVSL